MGLRLGAVQPKIGNEIGKKLITCGRDSGIILIAVSATFEDKKHIAFYQFLGLSITSINKPIVERVGTTTQKSFLFI